MKKSLKTKNKTKKIAAASEVAVSAAGPAEPTQQEHLPKDVPPAAPGYLSFQMHPEQIRALKNILTFSRDSLKGLAEVSSLNGNIENASRYSESSNISDVLLKTFESLEAIGEPVSRAKH